MKLLHKTTKVYLIITGIILIVSGFTLYLVLHHLITNEMDEELSLEADILAREVETGAMPDIPLTTITELGPNAPVLEQYGDSLVYDPVQNIGEDYRYLKVTKKIQGKTYLMVLMDAHIGWEEYYTTIFSVFLMMGLLFGASGAFMTFIAAKNIWHPFFYNLKALKKFSVSSPEPLHLLGSDIDEFRELKEVLKEQTRSSRKEFIALREFTENASHEIQTPLAVIQSKLDRLSQYPITKEMAEHIVHAKASVARLSRLNKDLLLLAKLNNRAFEVRERVDFAFLLQEQVEHMEEMFKMRDISLSFHISPVVLEANSYLCGTLISNLLSNAVRYTEEEGEVLIELTSKEFTVANTGRPLSLPDNQLFERFKKEQHHIKGTGLGLAIAKEICAVFCWHIQYRYFKEKHTFVVKF